MFLPSPSSQAELCTCPASEGYVALRDRLAGLLIAVAASVPRSGTG